MSYLQIPGGIPGFTKAVISLWFRVPQASIDKNVADRPPGLFPDDPRNVLLNIIPLVTIGTPPTSPRYEGNTVDVKFTAGGTPYPLPILDTPTFSKVADDPISPSYIGLYCGTDREGKNVASLEFNLQLTGRASVNAMAYDRNKVDTYGDVEIPPDVTTTPGSGWENGPSFGWVSFTTIVDNSQYWETQPEHFLVESSVTIAPDHWHHLLLSFDISNDCITHGAAPDLSHIGSSSSNASTAAGTNSYCRLWYAIDDVNYDSSTFDLGPFEVTGSPDLNAILTANAYRVARTATFLPYNCKPGTPQYSFAAEPIPTARLGIPASAECVNNVYNLEMAEFQMFTDVTLDTSVTANRRAFVDKDGDPVKPEGPEGKPAPAELLLGKRPDILLHGSSNWTDGRNTGSLGIDSDGNPIPSGQFVKTGDVPRYKPDPSLHGPQSPAPARRAAPVRLTRVANARL
jgi:hypothetical protein